MSMGGGAGCGNPSIVVHDRRPARLAHVFQGNRLRDTHLRFPSVDYRSGIWYFWNWAKRNRIMKIIDIEVIELRVPGWTGETFDGSYDNCLVLVHTDEGMTGIAEVDSVPAVIRAIVDAPRSHTHAIGLKQVLIGQDASDVEGLWDRMYDLTSLLRPARRRDSCHFCRGYRIVDLRGKMQGRSLGQLLARRSATGSWLTEPLYPLGETPDEVRKTSTGG